MFQKVTLHAWPYTYHMNSQTFLNTVKITKWVIYHVDSLFHRIQECNYTQRLLHLIYRFHHSYRGLSDRHLSINHISTNINSKQSQCFKILFFRHDHVYVIWTCIWTNNSYFLLVGLAYSSQKRCLQGNCSLVDCVKYFEGQMNILLLVIFIADLKTWEV